MPSACRRRWVCRIVLCREAARRDDFESAAAFKKQLVLFAGVLRRVVAAALLPEREVASLPSKEELLTKDELLKSLSAEVGAFLQPFHRGASLHPRDP